jgi:large repetitive protein
VTDGGGLSGCDSLTVSVAVPNVAPVVNAGADGSITAGGTFTRSGSFTDAGPAPWSATVNFGDGSGTQGLSLSGSSFTLSHVRDGGHLHGGGVCHRRRWSEWL